MYDNLNVAIGQCPAELVGPEQRYDWLERTLKDIRDWHLDLLILPELFLCGYNIGARVQEWAEEQEGHFARCIAKLAKENNIAIHYGFAEKYRNKLYNSALCIDKDGRWIGKHQKLLLPPGFEGSYFTAGNQCTTFKIGNFNVATLICYDAEFPETFRHVADADLIIVPTALGEQWGFVAEKLIPTRSFENGVFVCYANYCGQENDTTYLGGSCIISPRGEELARAGATETVLRARLNLEEVSAARNRLPYHIDRQKLPWFNS